MTCMKEKNLKKGRNFYVPDFVSEMLDSEGERYGGPGVVASSAILMFFNASDKAKRDAVKSFRDAEIDLAYDGLACRGVTVSWY